jgi:hypothetical protein
MSIDDLELVWGVPTGIPTRLEVRDRQLFKLRLEVQILFQLQCYSTASLKVR